MSDGVILSPEMARLVRETVDEYLERARSPRHMETVTELARVPITHQAPEVYVAYPCTSAGIPAREDGDPYTGEADQPGQALCDIYKIKVSELGYGYTNIAELIEVEGLRKRVYNITTSVLAQDYLIVHRDKFGRWLAGVGAGGGHSVISFEVISLAPYLVEISSACVAVNAEVLAVSCSAAGVAVGDLVLVYDPYGCWFTVPIDVLEGAHGVAMSMAKGSDWDVPFCVEDIGEGSCYWMVNHLCCMEDIYPS